MAKKIDAENAIELYRIYPKHVGRGAALKAIARAMAREEFGMLLESVEAYAAARKGHDMQFTPNPATWFNQERYHDDRAAWVNGKPAADKTERLWRIVLKAIRDHGAVESVDFSDPKVNAAIRKLGSWMKLCRLTADELKAAWFGFQAAYQEISDKGMECDQGRVLKGQYENAPKRIECT